MASSALNATPLEGLGPARLLSIDVEDVVVAATDLYLKDPPEGYRDSVANDMRRTLEVLERTGARATFFVNARYCDGSGDVFSDAVAQGHTLATHGYRHADVRKLGVDEFRDDLRRSLDTLSRYQSDIIGYRPPAFTMPFDDEHLTVLRDNGIRYVSCGALMGRVNVPPVERPVDLGDGLAYIPVSLWYLFGGAVRYPVGYGHTSRLMPEWLCVRLAERFARGHDFFQFYFHPYEVPGLNAEQKRRLLAVDRDIGFRIYSRRSGDRSRLFERILGIGGFEPIESLRRHFDG